MSSNLINFDRQQEHAFDNALVQGIQALDSYDASQVPQHLQQSHNLLRHQQQQQQQVQQQQAQQAHAHQQQSVQRLDHTSDQNNQRLLQQVPIDPSINDSASDKTSAAVAAAATAAAAANDLINVRNTAQAAVDSSSKLRSSNSGTPSGPKITKPRVNKPGQKFGAKKKSWVWNWFLQDPVDSNVATCDFCGKIIRRLASDKGSPKKLGEHLKTHKIDKNAINDKRDSVIVSDANRHYFNTLNATNPFKQHPLANETSADGTPTDADTRAHLQTYNRQPSTSTSQNTVNSTADFTTTTSTTNTSNNLNFDKSEFEQSPYTQPKFQKDIMKFLVENKLPLSVVKSSSFRQVIYTLKPEAIPDLNELNHLYSSLLEVIHNEKGTLNDVTTSDQHAGDVTDRSVSRHDDANVDDSLNASASGWV